MVQREQMGNPGACLELKGWRPPIYEVYTACWQLGKDLMSPLLCTEQVQLDAQA